MCWLCSPLFQARKGAAEPDSPKHIVDLFGLFRGNKGKKVGVLADEFGYIDSEDNLNYCNYHDSQDSNTYDLSKLAIKTITNRIDGFYLTTEQGSLSLYPVLENLDML